MAKGDLTKEKLLYLDELKQAERELTQIRGIVHGLLIMC